MTEDSIEPDDRGLVLACPKCGQRNRMVYERLGHKFRCAQCHTELSSPGQPIEVRKESVFQAVTGQSSLPVLVDFWAISCPNTAASPAPFSVNGKILSRRQSPPTNKTRFADRFAAPRLGYFLLKASGAVINDPEEAAPALTAKS
jgi:predicted RNA-binding Zn-ribbon protein involved in translation (DUF1610 family)